MKNKWPILVLILILIIAWFGWGRLIWAQVTSEELPAPGQAGKGASALSGLLSKPFGGRIISITRCFNGLKIKVGPPVSGDFVYMPGKSTLYAFYSLKPGSWVLGVASGKMICPTGLADGIIDIIGTSGL